MDHLSCTVSNRLIWCHAGTLVQARLGKRVGKHMATTMGFFENIWVSSNLLLNDLLLFNLWATLAGWRGTSCKALEAAQLRHESLVICLCRWMLFLMYNSNVFFFYIIKSMTQWSLFFFFPHVYFFSAFKGLFHLNSKQGSLEQVSQGRVELGIECFQVSGLHNLSGQPVQLHHHVSSTKKNKSFYLYLNRISGTSNLSVLWAVGMFA